MTPGQPSSVQFQEPAHSAERFSSPKRFWLLLLLFFLSLTLITAAAQARPYTVKSGDTLQRIAQRELGSANRWQEIARLNNLPAPHTIRVGQQIQLPEGQSGPIPLAPTPQSSSPAPPAFTPEFPVLPPGNPLPPDPVEVTSTPIDTGGPTGFNWRHLYWMIPCAILINLMCHALLLRVSSWFSLVETSYLTCLKLAVYLLLFTLLCVGMAIGMFVLFRWTGVSDKLQEWVFPVLFLTSVGLWNLLSLWIIKRTLECKWRSVVTILVMSTYLAALLGAIILFSSFSVPFLINTVTKMAIPAP